MPFSVLCRVRSTCTPLALVYATACVQVRVPLQVIFVPVVMSQLKWSAALHVPLFFTLAGCGSLVTQAYLYKTLTMRLGDANTGAVASLLRAAGLAALVPAIIFTRASGSPVGHAVVAISCVAMIMGHTLTSPLHSIVMLVRSCALAACYLGCWMAGCMRWRRLAWTVDGCTWLRLGTLPPASCACVRFYSGIAKCRVYKLTRVAVCRLKWTPSTSRRGGARPWGGSPVRGPWPASSDPTSCQSSPRGRPLPHCGPSSLPPWSPLPASLCTSCLTLVQSAAARPGRPWLQHDFELHVYCMPLVAEQSTHWAKTCPCRGRGADNLYISSSRNRVQALFWTGRFTLSGRFNLSL